MTIAVLIYLGSQNPALVRGVLGYLGIAATSGAPGG